MSSRSPGQDPVVVALAALFVGLSVGGVLPGYLAPAALEVMDWSADVLLVSAAAIAGLFLLLQINKGWWIRKLLERPRQHLQDRTLLLAEELSDAAMAKDQAERFDKAYDLIVRVMVMMAWGRARVFFVGAILALLGTAAVYVSASAVIEQNRLLEEQTKLMTEQLKTQSEQLKNQGRQLAHLEEQRHHIRNTAKLERTIREVEIQPQLFDEVCDQWRATPDQVSPFIRGTGSCEDLAPCGRVRRCAPKYSAKMRSNAWVVLEGLGLFQDVDVGGESKEGAQNLIQALVGSEATDDEGAQLQLRELAMTYARLDGLQVNEMKAAARDFSHSTFDGARLGMLDCKGCNMNEGTMREMHGFEQTWDGAALESVCARDVVLAQVSMVGTLLKCVDLRNGNMVSGRFQGATLEFSDLSGAVLIAVNFDGARFIQVNFDGATLTAASFIGAEFMHLSFAEHDLRGAKFAGATFKDVSFVGAGLQGADFGVGTLVSPGGDGEAPTTREVRASFSDVDFSGAELQGATFAGATLGSHVRFVGARLEGADLSGIVASSLTVEDFAEAVVDDATRLPKGWAVVDGEVVQSAE